MEIDWASVKKMTLWNYENLTRKILQVLSYNFIQEYYNHNMKEAERYAIKLLGYDPKYAKYLSNLTDILRNLDSFGIKNYTDLVNQVGNKEICEVFLGKTKLPFKDLISVLNYIFRWVLPFRNLYLRDLVDPKNETHRKHIEGLRKLDIKFNLDILEHCRTIKGRDKVSEETGIPKAFIVNLVNRADLTRLPYMGKSTVNYLCGGGYNSIDRLAQANIDKLRKDMKSHFNKIGVRLSKSFIELEGLIEWAKAVPKIVER